MKTYIVSTKLGTGKLNINDAGFVVKSKSPIFEKYVGVTLVELYKALKLVNGTIREVNGQ